MKTLKMNKEEKVYLNKIPDYLENEKPTAQEIKTVEKVLKYASQRNYIPFRPEDLLEVIQKSTSILKWNFRY